MLGPDSLKDKEIVLGVCGVSTAYKSATLVEEIRKRGGRVRVVPSEEAKKYVSPLTFEQITGKEVVEKHYTGEQAGKGSYKIPAGDVVVIAPASFSFLGKLSSDLGNDYLTEIVSQSDSPVLLAPSMNRNLYSSQQAKAQFAKLRDRGFTIVEPGSWNLTSPGQDELPLPPVPSNIIAKIEDLLKEEGLLKGKRVLITSGPTRKAFGNISNVGMNGITPSFGFKLGEQARGMGAEVLLASGPTDQIPPPGVGIVWVRNVNELDELLSSELPKYDLIIMVDGAEAWSFDRGTDLLEGEMTKKFDLEIPDVPDLAAKCGRLKEEGQVLVETEKDPADKDSTGERLQQNHIDGSFQPSNGAGLEAGGKHSGILLFRSKTSKDLKASNQAMLARELLKQIAANFFSSKG